MKVAVLGASDNPERYSYKAVMRLSENGHEVFPVHPKLKSIGNIPVFASLADIPGEFDTLTLYVSPEISSKVSGEILKVRPKRIIFNPGSENAELASKVRKEGIHTVEACTLTLLATRQFEKA